MAVPEKRTEPLSRDHISIPPVAKVLLPRGESWLSRHAFAWVCCFLAAMLIPVSDAVIRHVKLLLASGGAPVYIRLPFGAWMEDIVTTAVILTIFILPAVLIADWHASRVGARPWRDRFMAVAVACLLVFCFFVLADFLNDGLVENPLANAVLRRATIAVAIATCLYHWLATKEGKIGSARRAFTGCFRLGK